MSSVTAENIIEVENLVAHYSDRVILDGKSYRSPRPMENQLDSKTRIEK